MLTSAMLKPLLPPIVHNRHKYQAGYVIGLAGSAEMPGAALLSSLASLRAGAGITRLLHPAGMEVQLANSPMEVIKAPFNPHEIGPILETLNKASAVFIGPGLGRSSTTAELLRKVSLKFKNLASSMPMPYFSFPKKNSLCLNKPF